ncbi:EVE domain-containing protein [Alishewanella sp. 16-MA]|uniref:EVE domain-containing protein n=1 Tax=Alishewanella maricola TaxID=2795740 RepID=A0ABS8C4M2_9ALTE|nr:MULTISPECIES: EVE domain-containing protein [Alishewanella]MDP4945633.1 EVE domain-containing protein [Alishewanella sp.]MDP5206054.1 EVE domain-containing protein [Alishewanella sp. SMS9]MCB5227283.1 EVE domain-containing protein [Alishewanella maricola]MDP5034992.1 EVE domain-containing protein [Alishewanella sp.]MDP5186904.1 EVE domain-containing protein [Alishewanella sp.]
MNYWIFKTEPAECSIDDFANAPEQAIVWEGVRNYQARNFLRDAVKIGDQVLIYHSSCRVIGLAGIVEVVRAAYADPSQFQTDSPYYDKTATTEQPRWTAVDLRYLTRFSQVVRLDKIKSSVMMKNHSLTQRGNRLSVMPLSKEQWQSLLDLQ